MEMSEKASQLNEQKFTCKMGNRETRCGAPGCICIQFGPSEDDSTVDLLGISIRLHQTVPKKLLK
jgi:hypothetical protein